MIQNQENLVYDGWEVIDEGGTAASSGVFGDASEAIDAEIVSESPRTCTRASSQTVSPYSDGFVDLAETEHDEVFPTAAPKQVRRRKSKRIPRPRPRPAWQPGLDQRFIEVLAERASSGTRFKLSEAAALNSSVQPSGERISARMVQDALESIQASYHPEESSFNRVRIPRVKHLAIRFCEILAFHDLVHPCVRNYDLMSEAFMALRGIEAALKRWSPAYDE